MLKNFLFFILFLPLVSFAQLTFKVNGVISNQDKEVLAGVRVKIQGQKNATITNNDGYYSLSLKPGDYILNFSYLGFKSINVEVKVIDKDIDLSLTLQKDLQQLKQVVVEDQQARNTGMISVNSKLASTNPNVSQSFESILKQLPGVSTNNELSSQYSVRGGNFDENLIYINDIEIYKPYLVRNGQQEGLSLINPDLVGNVKFSAGGFGAKYGDKLSSVLDVTYKTFDRGIFEMVGPFGFTNIIYIFSNYINKTQSGNLNHYVYLFFVLLLFTDTSTFKICSFSYSFTTVQD